MQPDLFLFAAPATIPATIVAALFGVLIGSFLNVVAHRLPIMSQRELDNYIADESGKELPHQDVFNLMTPRSRCPHCGHRITALENIPILSWLVLRGKCSRCKAPISARYPLVEAITGLVSAALVWHFGSGWPGLAVLGGAYLLIPILLILLDTRTIADDLVYPLLWLGLLTNLNGFIAPLHDAVFSAFAAYMVLWTVNFLLEQLTRKSFIGNGLFKLAAAAGAWTGWLAIPAALFALPAPFADAAPASVAASVGAGLVGLLIGSFLNVVVHRLPIMDQREIDNYIAYQAGTALPHQDRFDLMVPRSRCPHCGHRITALENIPILSWLALRGKCSQCKAPISPRYPIVEAVTGLLAAALVWHFGSGWLGLAALAFGCILVALTLIDYDTKTLPDVLTYPLLWLGLLVNLNGTLVPLRDAVIGAVAGYLFLWTVSRLYLMVRGQIGMGEGDFKLLAGFGAWFGWSMLPALILMSAGVGSVVGVALILFRRIRPEQQIPFGPYLAGAGIIALFYGTPVMRLLLGLTV